MIDLDTVETTRPEVAAALRELESRSGKLTPEKVFEAAEEKSSALHRFFEWNRETGWKKYNLEVAASLLRVVKYQIVTTNNGVVRAPVYVRDPKLKPEESGYVALRKVTAGSETAHQIVLRECEAAATHLRRAAAIASVLGFSEEIESMVAGVLRIEKEIEADMKQAA